MAGVEHIIGIDLGTTNSVVAIIEDSQPTIILNAEGQPKTPSVVGFLDDGSCVVGEIARRQAATQPHRTISSAKRLIGRLKQEIDESEEVYPFELGEDDHGMVTIIVEGQAYLPEQISALILQKLKTAAEDHIGAEVKKAIITVPAYFDDIQRQATHRAAELAGLEVMRLINEPTAAALAYGLNKDSQETVAIYDFGGGTFDFSVLEIDGKTFEVLTSTGNSRLGGDDLDLALVDFIADRFYQTHGLDIRADVLMLRRVKDEAERAKCELSTGMAAVISLPFLAYDEERNPLHLEETITRDKFEELIESLVEETLQCCRRGIKESGIRKGQITKVILVGGSTRIPLVQEMVEDFFGIAPFRGVNPDEVVAVGAATQGAVLSGELEEVVLLDVTPHTLAIEVKGNRKSVIIEKNSTIPIKAYKTFTTTEDNQTFVNIHLLQGEEEKAADCRSLGKFMLSGIPEGRAGQPRIRVEIFVNTDGVVEVSAAESSSGAEQRLVTTCTYLNADERRAQHSQAARRRKRRRRASEDTQERRRPTPLGARPPRNETTPAVGRKREAETGERPDLASSFAEIGSAPAGSGDTPPRPGPARPAGPAAPPPKTPLPSEAAPMEEVRPSASKQEPSLWDAQTVRYATPPAASRDATRETDGGWTPPPPSPSIPEQLRPVFDQLAENRSDLDACEVYERDRDAFMEFCRRYPDDPTLQADRAKFLIFNKQPEEARDCINEMRARRPEDKAQHFDLFTLLANSFPNYALARRERAQVAVQMGDYATAMADLEFVAKRDESAPAVFDDLARIYEKVIADTQDASIQFKLVKMYLRRGGLDDAIALLQQLVQIPEHRDRANKVMGFCFWQKGLRYLAWQKFKDIPVDEEVKDTLYRLALDMEENDELVHARNVLEKLIGADISYKDSVERLKKINYRIELMEDDRYGAPAPVDGGDAVKGKIIADRFELIEEINRGSMGIVYKAKDKILEEIVAIKVLNDFLCADPHSVKRFKSECKSARRLTHSHIVRIHDFYDLDKKVISMEYIEGEDMRSILARNMTFSEEMVRNYLRQICDAMAYAHRLGIVHRDLKPANIMIDERNQVKVTDFGIAKVMNVAATHSGTMIVGTPLYMAPEQIDGRDIDQRADIYALGIMLYEMVTGNPPFFEGNIEYQHLHKQAPDIIMPLSPPLRRVIFRCIEKTPDARYQSIEELVADLDNGQADIDTIVEE